MLKRRSVSRATNRAPREIGHITVQPAGVACGCGNRGCLETVASGGALVEATRRLSIPLASQRKPPLRRRDPRGPRDGVPEVRKLFISMGTYLGRGLASIINVLSPSRMILCGEQWSRATSSSRPPRIRNLTCACLGDLECPVTPTRLTRRRGNPGGAEHLSLLREEGHDDFRLDAPQRCRRPR